MNLRDRVVEMKEEVENLRKEYKENSLAMDLLKELKAQNKRQHIIIVILICVIVGMVIGFFICENQFQTVSETEQTEQVLEDINNSQNSTYTQQIN